VSEKSRVLFLCTHNSARSQMAEGLLGHLAGDRFEAMSAGTEATHVRPLAIRAMEEIAIDISGQESKTLERYLQEPFDYVITVCDDANETCPFFPGAQSRLHWSFEDPSKSEGLEEERLEVFRRVRDEIELKIRDWLEHPEHELKKVREERERERRERLAASRWEADEHAQRLAELTQDGLERPHLPALA
jgi:arsenate reductase (thioredoxin)